MTRPVKRYMTLRRLLLQASLFVALSACSAVMIGALDSLHLLRPVAAHAILQSQQADVRVLELSVPIERELAGGEAREHEFNQPIHAGLVVEEVVADSPAAKAGLKVGDYLLTYDGKPLPSPTALQAVAENTFGKEAIMLRARRGDETLLLTVPPGRLGVQVRPELVPAVLTLYEQGRAAQQARKMDEVIARWTAAAKEAQEVGDKANAAWLQGRVGETYEGQRQWKEASAAHTAAWELLKQSGDAAAQSRTLVALGRCSQNLNDFQAAQQWYERAQQVDAAAGNEMWAASDLNSLVPCFISSIAVK